MAHTLFARTLGLRPARPIRIHVFVNFAYHFITIEQAEFCRTAMLLKARAETTVLVVDDSVDNLFLMKALLSEHGIFAVTVNSGKEALSFLRGGSFNLVFLDCSMPDITGYAVAMEARSWSRSPFIVAFTSDNSAENRQRCADCGMNGFLEKPCSPESLSKFLADHVSQKVA